MPYHYSKKNIYLSHLLEVIGGLFFFSINLFKNRKFNTPQKILIIEPFQMGDVISLTPMLEPIKKHFPKADIYILTKANSGFILQYDIRIKEILYTEFPWSDYGSKMGDYQRWFYLLKKLNQFKKYHFDIGIDTRGDVRSQLILNYLGCKEVVGYKNYLGSNVTLNGYLLNKKLLRAPYSHRYEWNTYLLKLLGIDIGIFIPVQMPSFNYSLIKKESLKIKTYKVKIVVHPGGGWDFKRWKNEKWIALIKTLSVNENYNITVIGGKSEIGVLEVLKNEINNTKIKFIVTDSESLINTIEECDLFIGLDSGPMNLAACMNKTVIALFGPGDSETWYPYTFNSKFIHKKENYPCNPCFQKKCFFPENSCMNVIEVRDVVDLVCFNIKN